MTSWNPSTQAADEATAVELPPALGLDFEAYVHALFSSVGWFVEPNTKEHDELHKDLFECDAVFRNPVAPTGQRVLAMEAKGGDWKVGDVVQLLGRARYINAEGSVFAYKSQTSNSDWESRVTQRLRELGLLSLRFPTDAVPDAGSTLSAAMAAGLTVNEPTLETAETVLSTQVFSNLVQRALRPNWGKLAKENPSDALEAVKRWNRQVYENLPLVADPVGRLARQEDAYRDFGKDLAVQVAKDLGRVPANATRLRPEHYEHGADLHLQAALLLQHTARLAVLATVIDIAHLLAAPELDAVVAGRDSRLGNHHWRGRIDSARMQPSSGRWALLWQIYLTRWGGFICTAHRETELALLGEEVGLAPEDVRAGLSLYDTFFPVPDGYAKWHALLDGEIEAIPGVPAALRGVGVLHRLIRTDQYRVEAGKACVGEVLSGELKLSPAATARLVRWYDVGVNTILSKIQ